jgi:Tfp pilus assembly protein PilV
MIKGQSMFEVVMALFIMALIIVGVVFLSTNSIANSAFSRNKTIAGRYSQEAVEWLRGQRDSDPTLFVTNATGTWCLASLGFTSHAACGSGSVITGTVFKRQVVFTEDGSTSDTIIKAEVTTSWTDSKGTHTAKSITEFTDIREK